MCMTETKLDVPTTSVRAVRAALRAVGAGIVTEERTVGAVGYTTLAVRPGGGGKGERCGHDACHQRRTCVYA